MNKNKYSLIVDGNYFLFRTLYVLPSSFRGTEILGADEDIETYIRKLATDLTYQIRLFDGAIDNVVWTLDSKSWRKDFYPEKEYKGTRSKDTKINWNNFKSATDAFSEILHKAGVTISKVEGAEGDDLIYAWNTEFLAMDKSTIILTGDRDMIQLVGQNKNNEAHTVFYTPAHAKLYTFEGFGGWLDKPVTVETDFFSAVKSHGVGEEQMRKSLRNAISKKNLDVIEQNPDEFMFKKVLTGDKGDNVAPAYSKVMKTKSGKERTYGVSDKKAAIIYDKFIHKHGPYSYLYLFSEDYLSDMANFLISELKITDVSKEQILINIRGNINLMILSSKTIPEEILDAMFKSIESKIGKDAIDNRKITSMQKLLAETKWAKDTNPSMSSSVFGKEKADNDMSFISDRKQKGTLF